MGLAQCQSVLPPAYRAVRKRGGLGDVSPPPITDLAVGRGPKDTFHPCIQICTSSPHSLAPELTRLCKQATDL